MCVTTAAQWSSQFAVARAAPVMLSALRGGFFFFFAACICVMGGLVWWLVPETRGRTLESMDEVFGCAYGDLREFELEDFRRERARNRGLEGKGSGLKEGQGRREVDSGLILAVDGNIGAEEVRI